MDKWELAHLGIEKLKMRFQNKINPEEYYLSYSGGIDSHLLYWFIKEILHDDSIKIVAVNTYREHNEIRARMYKYADEVLYPIIKMNEIKERYGMPCFSKQQDEYIKRYQNGCRTDFLMSRINGAGTMFGLNKRARTLLLGDKLHKVSSDCCTYTKKKPLRIYENKTGLKPIIATRGAESIMRKNAYQTCLTTKGKFTPLYDFSEPMLLAIYDVYSIEKPKIYDTLRQTGCMGCPYGYRRGDIQKELQMATPSQRKYAIDSFGESYEVLEVDVSQL